MDILEFLERTNHRNLKSNIEVMVKRRMAECVRDLERRRADLHFILKNENLQFHEELAQLCQARLAEAERQRLEWIGLERLKRMQAEEELLKLKKQQREIENCEEMRELQSRQILIETKQAQRYQIEERKELKRREKEIDAMWLKAAHRIAQAKAQQELHEQKLRRVIAGLTQATNTAQNEENSQRQQDDVLALQREYAREHEYAAQYDAKASQLQQFKDYCRKRQQEQMLQSQIKANQNQRDRDSQMAKAAEKFENLKLQQQLKQELWSQKGEWIRNRDWHKDYLAHAQRERNVQRARNVQFEQIYAGSGCVLQQSSKQPYGKSVR